MSDLINFDMIMYIYLLFPNLDVFMFYLVWVYTFHVLLIWVFFLVFSCIRFKPTISFGLRNVLTIRMSFVHD